MPGRTPEVGDPGGHEVEHVPVDRQLLVELSHRGDGKMCIRDSSRTPHITRAMRCAHGTPSIRNDALSKPIRRLVPPVKRMPATARPKGSCVTAKAWRRSPPGGGDRGMVFLGGRIGYNGGGGT